MPTIRLVPSSYGRSSTSRVTVTDPGNMYYDTDHTANYCSIRGRNSTSSTYYAFINGFNFDDVPANATVTAFEVKIRCYRNSYQQTGSTYRLRLASTASNNSVISDTTASTDIGTTASVITIPTGSLTWEQLSGYGSGLSIEIPLRPSSSQYPYVYVYGAEIEVTYSLPVSYDITASTNSGTISPAGTTSVYEGDSYTLTIDVTSPTVADNNVDVTSQLVQVTEGTRTLIPEDYTNTGFSISNIENAYADASSATSATLTAPAGGQTSTIYFELESLNLPADATIESVSCSATLQFSRNNSSSGVTASCQLYSGNTAKGFSTTIVSSATDVAKTTYNLTTGTWTASELANPRFFVTVTNNASGTQRIVYVYGVSFNVTYSIDGVIYTYTINNIQANHTIVVTAGAVTKKFYFKETSTIWTGIIKAWVKTGATTWTEQTVLDNVFDSNTNYIKGN